VFREGCSFLTDWPLEIFESSQLSPWPDYTGSPIDADQIPVIELTGGEGQMRGNAQQLTVVLGASRESGGADAGAARGARKGGAGAAGARHMAGKSGGVG
jgi:hypothetical protein